MGQAQLLDISAGEVFSRRLSARHSILQTHRRTAGAHGQSVRGHSRALARHDQRAGSKKLGHRNHIKADPHSVPDAKFSSRSVIPRAILAAQIALEKTRQTGGSRLTTSSHIGGFAAKLARRIAKPKFLGLSFQYEPLVRQPARTMEKVCAYLEINFDPDTV